MAGRLRITLSLCAAVLACGTAAARNILWRPTEKPPVSLERALTLAEAEVRKQGEGYYCIGATLAKTFSAGNWELHYSSRSNQRIWISVGSDEKVRTSREGFRY